MPIEFTQYPPQENTEVSGDTLYKMAMAYDGSGRRISKTRWVKARGDAGWSREHVTHYTGIGTEIRENMPGGTLKDVGVAVNMPNGLGRYGVEDAADAFRGVPLDENGKPTSWSALNPKFEWYLKNHLGSTMLVYSTAAYDDSYFSNFEGGVKAAYDYRSFGEQVTLAETADKVTENFTGKEKDDETQLDYFGARYLDPMLGMWTSVDPARQFASPYLYAGNGVNPVNGVDGSGKYFVYKGGKTQSVVKKYYDHLPKDQQKRFNQLQESRFRYEIGKIDEIYPDPDFNDDEHFLGGLAWPETMSENGKTEVGGRAVFINARYFLHEVLQHLFDIEKKKKKNGGDVQKTTEEYKKNEKEWEDRAFENEEVEMPGLDIDEI